MIEQKRSKRNEATLEETISWFYRLTMSPSIQRRSVNTTNSAGGANGRDSEGSSGKRDRVLRPNLSRRLFQTLSQARQ
jgi:hypothetical protein